MESKITSTSTFEMFNFNGAKQTRLFDNTAEIFTPRTGAYINDLNLFIARFTLIPNLLHESRIDCNRACKWFSEVYKDQIKELYYYRERSVNRIKPIREEVFYFIYEDLLIYFDLEDNYIRFLFQLTESKKVDTLINSFRNFKIRKSKRIPSLSLLISGRSGIEMKSLEISKPKMNLEDNYNTDFGEVHKTILRRLSKKNDKGLVLLHGKPGTGKTSYIRYLISVLRKNVIFLPLEMASVITSPGLVSILIENPNSILVIEDAENIVVDRERNSNSRVSALLNISDGLLSDCLNIQIICSFNTDISKVDSALMRKGRLIAKYEFKELEVEKARALSKKIGFNTEINSPMVLTAIYNQAEKDFIQTKQRNPIGFMAHSN